jgi:hypothetical protein
MSVMSRSVFDVFLSSTSRDLAPHRAGVSDMVARLRRSSSGTRRAKSRALSQAPPRNTRSARRAHDDRSISILEPLTVM